MGRAGFILVWVGFLGGAWVGVQDPLAVRWPWLAAAVGVGVAGVVLSRRAARAAAEHRDTRATNLAALGESLGRIVANAVRLDAEKESMNPYDAHGRIDELFPEDLGVFVEARETIGHVYGLQAYADVMNHFAAGERYLNRVWSASVDGWVDEVKEYLGRAREQFEEAQARLERLRAAQRSG